MRILQYYTVSMGLAQDHPIITVAEDFGSVFHILPVSYLLFLIPTAHVQCILPTLLDIVFGINIFTF